VLDSGTTTSIRPRFTWYRVKMGLENNKLRRLSLPLRRRLMLQACTKKCVFITRGGWNSHDGLGSVTPYNGILFYGRRACTGGKRGFDAGLSPRHCVSGSPDASLEASALPILWRWLCDQQRPRPLAAPISGGHSTE
jgi:hypothetical protein